MYYIDFFVSRSDFYKKPFPNIGLQQIEELFSERNETQKNQQNLGLEQDDKINQLATMYEQNMNDSKQIQDESQIKMTNQVILVELRDSSQDSQNLDKKQITLRSAKIMKQLAGSIMDMKKNKKKYNMKQRKDVKCTCKKNQCCNLYCGCYQIQKHCTKSCKCKKIQCLNMPNTSSQLL